MAPGLRWGILATGGIARAFTSDLTASGFTVTAAGSRSQSSADDFAARFGIPHAHGSYEALVRDDTVDAVYVATPHPMHHECALLAIEAGKHVLVEKSFTVNAAQARELADRAAERGVVVMEAMWTRFLPHMVRIHEILAAGDLGDVRTVLADHSQSISTDPKHRLQNPDLGGGALLDLGIYKELAVPLYDGEHTAASVRLLLANLQSELSPKGGALQKGLVWLCGCPASLRAFIARRMEELPDADY